MRTKIIIQNPVLKKFDAVAFGEDVFMHRTGMNITRKDYAIAVGYENNTNQEIDRIEKGYLSKNINVIYNICSWMGKDINQYFV